MTVGLRVSVAGVALAVLAGLSIHGAYRLGQQAGTWSPADKVVVHDVDLAAALMMAAGDQRADNVIVSVANNVVANVRGLRASTSPRRGDEAVGATVERLRLNRALTEASRWANSDEARKALVMAQRELSSL